MTKPKDTAELEADPEAGDEYTPKTLTGDNDSTYTLDGEDDEAPAGSIDYLDPPEGVTEALASFYDEDALVEVVEAVDVGPPVITPSSTPDANNDRIAWENEVNAAAEKFAADAHATFIEATVAGGTVEIVVTEAAPVEADDTEE